MQIRHNLRIVEFLGIYENGNANMLSGMEFLGIPRVELLAILKIF